MRRLALLPLLLVALAACGGDGGGEPAAGGAPPETSPAEAAEPSGPLAEYRGKPLVANVWASW